MPVKCIKLKLRLFCLPVTLYQLANGEWRASNLCTHKRFLWKYPDAWILSCFGDFLFCFLIFSPPIFNIEIKIGLRTEFLNPLPSCMNGEQDCYSVAWPPQPKQNQNTNFFLKKCLPKDTCLCWQCWSYIVSQTGKRNFLTVRPTS